MPDSDATTGAADSFDPNVNLNGIIHAIAIQSDGKILVGGDFINIGGQPRKYIARLDPVTGLADSFDSNPNNSVSSLAIQSDGKILVNGSFGAIGGQPRRYIARLDSVTGNADSFNPNPDDVVRAIAIQSDGKILVGGFFLNIGGQQRNRIARLDAVTGLADSFDPSSSSNVNSIAVQSDGKILAGGNFTNIGGQPRFRIARLDATTGAADSFNPNANSEVYSIAVQPDGKILVGGFFTTIGGQTRIRFARLSNDTAALSTLTITKNTITLTRDGSAAQFARVIFEQSTDNGATYTTLGTATNSRPAPAEDRKGERFAPDAPTAAGYTLTGLNLPTGQKILIRARGFYHTGYFNSSETIEDKVQNAFLLAPTAASVSVSGKVLVGKGTGLENAVVTLTDSNGETRTVRTTSFGYYRFDDVEVGQSYTMTVRSRRYLFSPQIITINEVVEDLNFMAQ